MKLKPWTVYLFRDIPEKHYFHDNIHIWQSVKSKEVYNGSGGHPNYSPDTLVMKCVGIIEPDKAKYKIGAWTQDFFSAKFQYIGAEKWEVKLFKYFLIKEYKKHLIDTKEFKELEKWYEGLQRETGTSNSQRKNKEITQRYKL